MNIATLSARLRVGLKRAFAPRDLILRSNAQVRYLRVGVAAQIVAAPLFAAAAGAAGYAVWSYTQQDEQHRALVEELDQAQQDYIALLRDVGAFERSLAALPAEAADPNARAQAAMARETLRQRLYRHEAELTAAQAEKSALSQEMAAMRAQLSRDEVARAEMRAARETMSSRIAALTAERNSAQAEASAAAARIAALESETTILGSDNETLTGERDALTATLDQTRDALEAAAAMAEARALELESTIAARDALEDARDRLIADREDRVAERDRAQMRLDAAETRILDLEAVVAEGETVAAAATSARAAAETARDAANARALSADTRLAEMDAAHAELFAEFALRAEEHTAPMERAIAMTGVNVRRLVDQEAGARRAQGGPYLATARALDLSENVQKAATDAVDALARLEALRTMLRVLPLDAPMNQYRVTSSFGRRTDPVNGRQAMHYGLDLAGPMKTPIFATSPGKVTFAGWKGNYGRFVEIDHGRGVRTRYGHLHKILVRPGERVDYRDRIGLMGNSGRSTGPHLHYEVKVQGRPLNPQNFITAGRHVLKNR